MKIIKDLIKQIEEELEGAEDYAKEALFFKTDKPNISRMYAQMSEDEMGHVNKLHASVTDLIEEYRRTKGEPPAAMQAVYDYEHEKYVDHAKEIRLLQAMIRD